MTIPKIMPLYLLLDLVGKALVLLAVGMQLNMAYWASEQQKMQHALTREYLRLMRPITKEWLDGAKEPVVPGVRRKDYEYYESSEKELETTLNDIPDLPAWFRLSEYWSAVFFAGSLFTLAGTYLEKRKKF